MALEFAAEEYRETMLEKSKQQIQETEKYGYDKEDTDTLNRNENLSETEEIKRMDDKLISAGDRLLLNTESLRNPELSIKWRRSGQAGILFPSGACLPDHGSLCEDQRTERL